MQFFPDIYLSYIQKYAQMSPNNKFRIPRPLHDIEDESVAAPFASSRMQVLLKL